VPAVEVLGYHTTDGDTISHHKLNGDGVDDANAYNLGTFTADPVPFHLQGDFCQRMAGGGADDYRTNSTEHQILTAVSCAALLFLRSAPGTNIPIMGASPIGGGAGSANNYLYSLELNTDRTLRYFHQSGSKVNQAWDTTLTVPLDVWTWVAFGRAANGIDLEVAMNGATQSNSVAAAPADGVNCDFTIATKWDSNNIDCYIASVICKDIQVTDFDSWRDETGFVV
jgi:hypothetical protein